MQALTWEAITLTRHEATSRSDPMFRYRIDDLGDKAIVTLRINDLDLGNHRSFPTVVEAKNSVDKLDIELTKVVS